MNCFCGKPYYVKRLNEAGVMEYLCLQHLEEMISNGYR